MPKYKFQFAISYASEDVAHAKPLAEGLQKEAKVYFAPFYQAALIGKKMGPEFQASFGRKTRFFVPIISGSYEAKDYTQFEWQTAVREAAKRRKEFILPIRLDDTPLVGLHMDVAFIDLRITSVNQAVQILLSKVTPSKPKFERQWMASFGILMEDLQEKELPAEAPTEYPLLCDWLIEDLLGGLRSQGLETAHFLEDHRDGEGLSVRVGFVRNDPRKPPSFVTRSWWQLLELMPQTDV